MDVLLYYAVLTLITVFFFLRRRPRKGMRLKLREGLNKKEIPSSLNVENFTHIEPPGERPLNVMFNYNGHSWDAYEVLGLPAGSALEKVTEAYRKSLSNVEASSKPFLEAAYRAIETQWHGYRKVP